MAYPAAQIANFFIDRGSSDKTTVDPLKLQKLVYLAHGWYLAFLKEPLIKETVEAWKYGPVVPTLYREFRKFGYSTIDQKVPISSGENDLDEVTRALLGVVWAKYGKISGIELSALTHEPGYAWDLSRKNENGGWNSPVIPNEWIRDEFERRLSGNP